ncbi:MAG: OmpA family protein [Endomicrobium sp.]|jgi:predicted outer membrane repeat protein|nr:OmpA family protein [Endomicrobium sp.]
MKQIKKLKKLILVFIALFFMNSFSYALPLTVGNWNELYDKYRMELTPYHDIEFLNDTYQPNNSYLLGTGREPGGVINGMNYSLRGGVDMGFNFESSVFVITDVGSTGGPGGGMANIITFKDIRFQDFKNYDKGVIYGKEDSSIVFSGTMIEFKNNYGYLGTSLYLEGQTFFTANDIRFTDNLSIGLDEIHGGAAIRAVGGNSKTSFVGSGNVLFSHNTAIKNGGAIYAEGGASLLFDGYQVAFEYNSAYNGILRPSKGGAIYIVDAQITFQNSGVSFSNNTAFMYDNEQSAGAIFGIGASIIFSGSQVAFEDNIAAMNVIGVINTAAGAIYVEHSLVSFNDSSARFLGNLTSVGTDRVSAGSIFMRDVSTLAFSGSTVNFENGGRGGGDYSQDSSVIISNSILRWTSSKGIFNNNISTTPTEGGAALKMFSTIGYKTFMFSDNSEIDFTNNTSQNGGALYTVSSSITIRQSKINFEGNTAISSGGALFAGTDAKIYFFDSTTVFSGNSAGLRGDALYLAGNAEMHFIGGLVSFNNYGNINSVNDIWFLENSAKLNFSSGSVEAIGNKADVGAFLSIINRDFVFGRNANFANNTARDFGGALYMTNNAKVSFGGQVFFTENTANRGGAVYLLNSTIAANNADILFIRNSANDISEVGGAIYAENSFIDFKNSTAVFNQNTAREGNSIYLLMSTMAASGGSVIQFANNTTTNSGAGIYAEKSSITFFASSISFSNNYASTGAGVYLASSAFAINAKEIYFLNNIGWSIAELRSKINISASTLVVSGNYAGNGGAFNIGSLGAVVGASNMQFANNSAHYGGAFYVKAGSSISINGAGIFENNIADNLGGAIYNAGFLDLQSRNSTMVFINNSAGVQKNDIYNTASSTISISGDSGSVEINGGIDGGGWIIKTGRGGFTINTDNGFNGTFIQRAGTTTITNLGKMFHGNNFIENSLLKVIVQSTYSFNLTINERGVFEYYNGSETPFEINSATIKFNSNNAFARFNKDAALSGRAAYYIANDIGNNSQNTIEFYNANAVFGSQSYQKGTRYVFSDSAIDLTSSTPFNDVKTTSFSYLQAVGTGVYLTFGLYVDASGKLFTDILYSAQSLGSLNIKEITIYKEFSGLLPIVDTYIEFSTRVITGAGSMEFNPITQWTNIVTDEYQYIINVDVSSSWISVIFARHPEDSLNVVNMDSGNREYRTKIIAKLNPTSNTYHILENLGLTGSGTFYLSSASISSGGVNLLSGLSRLDQTTRGSFFKLVNVTALIIDKLSISSAYASGSDPSTATVNGSIIYMTNQSASAILRDTNLFYNLAEQDGGAIYATNGILKIESASQTVSIVNNSARNSGGVIFTENARTTVSATANKNITFSHNQAVNGGVLYGLNNSQTYFSGSGNFQISFLNNTASFGAVFFLQDSYLNWTKGTSIFEDHTADADGGDFYSNKSSIVFNSATASWTNNRALNGSGGVFYLDMSTLNFNSSLITWTNNTAVSHGGAVYLRRSSANFNNSTMSFVHSRSGGQGGFAYIQQSNVNFDFVNANWLDSTADLDGGIFYVDGNSKVNFRNGNFNFNNAFSGSNGGAFNLNNSIVVISSARAAFVNNSAVSNGGVFYMQDSNLSFINSQSSFSNSSAADGGAFYLQNSNISFSSGQVLFSNTRALGGNGGVFYLNQSTLSFSSIAVSFVNSSAKEDGNIIYAQDSLVNLITVSSGLVFEANQSKNDIWLSNSNLNIQTRQGSAIIMRNGIFASNSSINKKSQGELRINKTFDFSGGYFTVEPKSRIVIENIGNFSYSASSSIALSSGEFSFVGSKAHFIGNRSDNYKGGALSLSNSSLSFINSPAAEFSANSAAQGGGAIFLENNSYANFYSAVFVSNNVGAVGGGAIALKDSYAGFYETTFNSNNAGANGDGGALYLDRSKVKISNSLFVNNAAGYRGGAIYAQYSSLEMIDSQFSGNSSGLVEGGAVYLLGSTMTITADNSSLILGAAGNREKYFYLSNSQLVLDAENKKDIRIDNQIYGDGENTILRKQGSGDFRIYSIELNHNDSKFYLDGGKFYFDNSIRLGKLYIGGGALFELKREGRYTEAADVRTISVNELRMEDGTLEIGAFIDPSAATNKIKIDTITDLNKVVINNGNDTKLIVNFYGMDISNVINQENHVLYMDFGGWAVDYAGGFKWYASPNLKGYRIKSNKGDNGVYLDIVPLRTIDNPTHNEQELLNLFASVDGGKDIAIYLRNAVDDLIASNPAMAKKAIGQMSGGFYANALRTGAMTNADTVLYPRIQKINKDEALGDIIKSVWVGGVINSFTNDAVENSAINFESTGYGINAGFNIFTQRDSLVGLYIGYIGTSLTQDLDKASVSDIGIGAYGGSFAPDLIIKWNLGGAFQSYTFDRVIQFSGDADINPNSSFNTQSIKGGVEVDFVKPVGKNFVLKPFLGAQGALAFNGKITETGGDFANLTIDDDTYLRFLAMGGAMLSQGDESSSWFIKAGLNYLLSGSKAQYKIGFVSENDRMEIWSHEENPFSFTVGAGLETVIWRAASIYVNINARFASDAREYIGNFGLNYRFEKTNKELMSNFKERAENMEAEMTSEALLKKQMHDLEVELLKKKIRLEEEADGPVSEAALREQIRAEIEAKKAQEAEIAEAAAIAAAEATEARKAAAAEAAAAAAAKKAASSSSSIGNGVAVGASSLDQRLAAQDLGKVDNRQDLSGLPWAGGAIEPRRVVNTSFEEDEELLLDDNSLNEQIAQSQSRKTSSTSGKSTIRAFSLSAATFKPGNFELTNAAKTALAKLAREIQSRPFKKIVIEGHTDASGEIQKNLVLSHKRAREVRKELYKNGIPLNKMAYIGFGPTMPIATNNTELGRSKNRRVEIYVE